MIKILFLCFLFLSCATVDIEKNLSDSGAGKQDGGPAFDASEIFPDPQIIVRERPVFVPEKQTPPARPATGAQAVRESNDSGIVKPSDYSHAAMIYDYDPDWVYEVYAMPLRVCDIRLEPGERAVEPPFVSDSERWILGAGVSHENGAAVQHIYVKPESAGLEASLIINTDRRVYHIILRSFRDLHMPIVRWRYLPGLPSNYIQPPQSDSPENGNPFPGIDPRSLSFNYRITFSLFRKPPWLPELVFDDGSKTYITFPELVLQRELPAVFENRRDILNYRVLGRVIIIDKLIENITVKIARAEVTITKRKANVR